MGLFQVVVRSQGESPRTLDIDQSPWIVGRGSESGLVLTGPGVFERHLILRTVPGEGVVVEVGPGALARVAGNAIQRHRLRNGDVVDVGRASLSFVLAPVRRRSLEVWTLAFWLVVGAVALTEAAALIRLANP